jgi:hypothetical protein
MSSISVPPIIDDATFRKLVLQALGPNGVTVTGVNFTGGITLGAISIDHSNPGVSDAVRIIASVLPTNAAQQDTLAAVLAKISGDPATGTLQGTGNTSLASILAKITGDPSTATLQGTTNGTLSTISGKVALDSSLQAILAKQTAGASTEATLAALNAKVTAVNTGATVVSSGNIIATPVSITRANSTAYEAGRLVKNSSGRAFNVSAYNSGPAQFLQLHDAASAPADGVAPAMIFALPAQSSVYFDFGGVGLPFSNGIYICNSSTGPTKTLGGVNSFFTVGYL